LRGRPKIYQRSRSACIPKSARICPRLDSAPASLNFPALGLDRVLGAILRHADSTVSTRDLGDQVLVVAPELEFVWKQPELDAGCRVPGLPLYVVGDAAGIAQGIVQGAMMGMAAAQAIAAGQTVPTNGAGR